ncbi:LysR substrate-binding domain-containing protein [Promicromonospora thailandica]|uniref:DNA-binding transcriptional regulator, LysR family n=1 Tax=Promicromonospora thailandica TaxID=765201 RepID=A0A9X2JXS7_9MICO|nr:LysR substrate-binding domain-containing protein [Promicromonospora thailandica]MCP2264439.1 DNA-binding transcriptional regulator, LysR family [Promicromonospora thailandica]BFF20505.1 LysR family transcriptional regulator [Promicromonospora thailandica]
MLNPWRLRLLHQLHLLGTVRAVAEATRLSPSSVSQQLATLEAETRVQLFERSGRRIRLTPAGVTLAGHASDILDRIATAEADLAGLYSEPTGVVRLAAFTSAFHGIVVPAVADLAAEHPRISVQLTEAEPLVSRPAVQRGEVDVAVCADFPDAPVPPDADLARLPLTGDRVVLVTARDTAAGPRGRIDLAALADEPWAFEHPGAHLADLAERLCRRAGFTPRTVARFESHGTLLSHVEAGLSVTLLPMLAVHDRYAVRTLDLVDPPRRDIHLVTRRTTLDRAAVRVVVDAVRQRARAS